MFKTIALLCLGIVAYLPTIANAAMCPYTINFENDSKGDISITKIQSKVCDNCPYANLFSKKRSYNSDYPAKIAEGANEKLTVFPVTCLSGHQLKVEYTVKKDNGQKVDKTDTLTPGTTCPTWKLK